MNRSYSKIKHIQESNIKLERRVLNEIGFMPSYREPEIDAVINFDAPDATKDLKPILKKFIEGKHIRLNDISGGNGGRHNSYRLDISFFNERDVDHLINDLHVHMMVAQDVRIRDVTHYIK
jgi:hypothetical protein